MRPHHWLALVPALGILVGVPFANRVHPFVLGLPFLLFWILACVVLTSGVLALIGVLDRARPQAGPSPEEAPPAGRGSP